MAECPFWGDCRWECALQIAGKCAIVVIAEGLAQEQQPEDKPETAPKQDRGCATCKHKDRDQPEGIGCGELECAGLWWTPASWTKAWKDRPCDGCTHEAKADGDDPCIVCSWTRHVKDHRFRGSRWQPETAPKQARNCTTCTHRGKGTREGDCLRDAEDAKACRHGHKDFWQPRPSTAPKQAYHCVTCDNKGTCVSLMYVKGIQGCNDGLGGERD